MPNHVHTCCVYIIEKKLTPFFSETTIIKKRNALLAAAFVLLLAVGSVVYENRNEGQHLLIDVSKLPAGYYNVTVDTEASRINKKVVIVRQ